MCWIVGNDVERDDEYRKAMGFESIERALVCWFG